MYRALLIAIFFLNKKNIAIFLKLYKVEKSQQKAIVVLLRLPQSVDKVPANAGTLSVLITVFLIE